MKLKFFDETKYSTCKFSPLNKQFEWITSLFALENHPRAAGKIILDWSINQYHISSNKRRVSNPHHWHSNQNKRLLISATQI